MARLCQLSVGKLHLSEGCLLTYTVLISCSLFSFCSGTLPFTPSFPPPLSIPPTSLPISPLFSLSSPSLSLPLPRSLGSCLGKSVGVSAPQPPPRPELGSTELTVLNLLRDRRDSSGSATSSAYLSSSRRSSGISPCFSSRRSSQASQCEGTAATGHHRRLHNLSSTDSYDPISTDASRRSSEASHCGGGGGGGCGGQPPCGGWGGAGGGGVGGGGGSRGMLSLTPAQHYHLKAKYAAATGGPPPTPLPNMECMSLKTRMAMMDVGQDGGNLSLPPLVRPRRCSDGMNGFTNGYTNGYMGHAGYRRRVFYPGECPGNSDRRASDPVRTQAPDSFDLPQVQRFNSLNNIHPLPPLSGFQQPTVEGRSFSLQNYTRSEGNLQRGLQHSPCPPSIMEHSALEALAMEEEGEAGLLLGDEDMLPDDLVQYLHSQAQTQAQAASYNHLEDHMAPSQGDLSHPSLGEIEQIHGSGLNLAFPGPHSPQQHQQQQDLERGSPSKLPIQWNEVSSGSAERSPQRGQTQQRPCGRWQGSEQGPTSAPFGRFGNMMVQQQVQFPRDFPNSCAQASQSQAPCRVNPGVKLETSSNSCMEMRGNGHNPTHTFGRPDFSHITIGPLPQGYGQSQSHFQQNHNSSTSHRIGDNLVLSRASMDTLSSLPSLSQGPVLRHSPQAPVQRPPASSSYRNMARTQQYLNPENTSDNQASLTQQQPRSGTHCSLVHQVSGLKLEAPDQGYLDQGFSDPLCFETVDTKASPFPGLEDQCLLDSMAESVGLGGGGSGGGSEDSATLLSPGTDQVTSTVDNGVAGVLDEVVSLDFGAMLEDGFDQRSLVSGVISPSIFQGLSRTSSRLTTPRASNTFHSVPTIHSNMAIGDMSSLLTTLAEESKFLAIMQ